MKAKIFIDGSEGTTGLRIHERFQGREDIELLTIAPELFADDQWDPMFGTGSANAELTYEFTVGEGDGVSSVSVDESKVTVYTLNGVKVLDNADRESLRTLKKGIYIVNGKKTVVK